MMETAPTGKHSFHCDCTRLPAHYRALREGLGGLSEAEPIYEGDSGADAMLFGEACAAEGRAFIRNVFALAQQVSPCL